MQNDVIINLLRGIHNIYVSIKPLYCTLYISYSFVIYTAVRLKKGTLQGKSSN